MSLLPTSAASALVNGVYLPYSGQLQTFAGNDTSISTTTLDYQFSIILTAGNYMITTLAGWVLEWVLALVVVWVQF